MGQTGPVPNQAEIPNQPTPVTPAQAAPVTPPAPEPPPVPAGPQPRWVNEGKTNLWRTLAAVGTVAALAGLGVAFLKK